MVQFWRRVGLSILVFFTAVACNLTGGTDNDVRSATYTPFPTKAAVTDPQPSPTPTGVLVVSRATLTGLPRPGTSATSTPISVTSVPSLGKQCQVYQTYSGRDPRNFLSLRQEPNATAAQVFKVPNNINVLLVPETQEVEAGGYHWLNVIYEAAPGSRFIGWIARDSYQVGGVRNPTIATLVRTETTAAC
jgi:hypothetical protein